MKKLKFAVLAVLVAIWLTGLIVTSAMTEWFEQTAGDQADLAYKIVGGVMWACLAGAILIGFWVRKDLARSSDDGDLADPAEFRNVPAAKAQDAAED
jgi:hypothetical protein